MTLEAHIEDEFCNWVDQQGGVALKLQIDGQRGFPDRTILLDGYVCFIEFKRPRGRLSQHQKDWISRLEDRGFQVAVCDNVADAMEFVLGVIDDG